MRITVFFITFLLVALISGCVVGEKDLSQIEGEKSVSLDHAITEYLENDIILIPPPIGVKTFAAYDLLGLFENGNGKTAYLLADIRTYGVDPGIGVGPRSASFVPLELTLKEENNGFAVIRHRQPGDGSNYWPDIKQIFPEEYHDTILNYHKTGRGREMEPAIREKVNIYLKSVGIDSTV